MKMPVLLLSAAILFWGWQTGLWFVGLPMAIAIAASYSIQWRWDLAGEDFRRIANLCLILFLILTVYLLASNPSIYFIYALFQWLPVVFFPLVAAQIYSTSDRIDIRTLLLLPSQALVDSPQNFGRNLTYPYFAVCILAASAANTRGLSFFIGMFILLGLALWQVRSRRFPPTVWLCLLLLAGGMGFVGQMGLYQFQRVLEQNVIEWLSGFDGQGVNLIQTNTSIGDIGLLKLSNQIVLRVQPSEAQSAPRLLRQAAYDKYQSSIWLASNPSFTPIEPDSTGTTWRLGKAPANGSTLTVSATRARDTDVLALPDRTFQLDQLPASSLEKNPYGSVKVAGEPGFVAYQIQYGAEQGWDSPPTENDLQIAEPEKPALQQILQELDLDGKPPQAVILQIERFFQTEFQYSLDLVGKNQQATPLSAFLLQNRTGHCEYFATATTLLLRAAGIPARYAVGYSVHEFHPLENQYIVRGRHAHAWTLVYLNGAWQVLDTTPPDWNQIEDAAASEWEWLTDLGSWVSFKLAEGLWQIRTTQGLQHLGWFVVPVVGVLVRRLNRKKRARPLAAHKLPRSPLSPTVKPGVDSEFYLIEQTLTDLGLGRAPTEPLGHWLERLKQELTVADLMNDLQPILDLHYRYRFDPAGLREAERAKLTSAIQAWLERYRHIA